MRYPVRNLGQQSPIPAAAAAVDQATEDEFWRKMDKTIDDTQNLIGQTQDQLSQVQKDIAQKNQELDSLEAIGASPDRLREAGGQLNDLLNTVGRLEAQIVRLRNAWNYWVKYRADHGRGPSLPMMTPTPSGKPAPAPLPAKAPPPAAPPAPVPAQAPAPPPVPTVAKAPAPPPVATGPESCTGTGQFWDGRECRTSIGPVSGIPVQTPGGAQTLPGLTEQGMAGRQRYRVINL